MTKDTEDGIKTDKDSVEEIAEATVIKKDEVKEKREEKERLILLKRTASQLSTWGLYGLPLHLPGDKIKRNGEWKESDGKDSLGIWNRDRVLESYDKKNHTDERYRNSLYGQAKKCTKLFNIGAIIGEDFVDVDIDNRLALKLAQDILPDTTYMFGRESAGSDPTHYLYRVKNKPTNLKKKKAFAGIVEYRTGPGCLTVFPPSLHKSDCYLKWYKSVEGDTTGPTKEIDAWSLYEDVKLLAIATALCGEGVLEKGAYHNAMRCIAGGLFKMTIDHKKIVNVIGIIAEVTGQEGVAERRQTAVDTIAVGTRGGRLDGWGSLREFVGDEKVLAVIKRIDRNTAEEDFEEVDIDDDGELIGELETAELFEGVELLNRLLKRAYLYNDGKGVKVVDTTRSIKGDTIPYAGFEARYAAYSTLSEDGKKRAPIVKLWRGDVERRELIGDTYVPGKGRIVEGDTKDMDGRAELYLNNFYMPPRSVNKRTDRIQIFFTHMEFLFPESEDRELMYDFLSFCIQCPNKRVKWAPVLVSERQGLGKGYLLNMMVSLLGWNNVSLPSMNMVVNPEIRFNGYLHNKQFVCIDEAKEGDRKHKFAMSDKLKHIITEDYQEIELKGENSGLCKIYAKMMFLTNHTDAVAIDQNDRRLWVHYINWEPREPEHYTELFNTLEDEVALDQLWTWFESRDLGLFDPNAAPPMTKGKLEMIGQNRCTEERLLLELLHDQKHHQFEVLAFSQIMELLEMYNETKEILRNWMVRNQLRTHCRKLEISQQRGGRLDWNGGKATPWVIGGDWSEETEYDTKEIRAILDANQNAIDFPE